MKITATVKKESLSLDIAYFLLTYYGEGESELDADGDAD